MARYCIWPVPRAVKFLTRPRLPASTGLIARGPPITPAAGPRRTFPTFSPRRNPPSVAGLRPGNRVPGRHLHPCPQSGEVFPGGKFVVVTVAEGTFLLPRALVERAQGIGADRLYQGGLVLLANVAQDSEALGKNGLDPAWRGHFHDNNER